MNRRTLTIDANEAVASVAHRVSEVIALYPITPASPMGELCDEYSAAGKKNLWGTVPSIVELQSEAGAIGAVHGALQAGALATTFTAAQGLLLMIPNMYKIGGELTPFVLHVAARTLATHALSIFGDHSDVMACRQTGFALLCSGNAQEAHDLAAISHAATLESRVPFLHFFDGFRTSHEITKIEELGDDDLRALLDEEAIAAHKLRALTPDRPVVRGTAQNPDTFFQAREAANGYYDACPRIVERVMERFAAKTGRRYGLFDYVGHPEAERVVILMGSGAETAHEAVTWMMERGEKVGVLKVRLYRPLDAAALLAALPKSARGIAVLDRTKEPGAPGDPLYLDVVTALAEARAEGRSPFAVEPRVVAGRYGLSSKEFTPAMVKAIFDDLAAPKPMNHYTVGIVDDVTHRSLPYDAALDIEPDDIVRAVFFGLGSDGTVSANKSAIKIIGGEADKFAQGYFVYDSKKAGAVTVSHLRFGPRPIRSSYLISRASFVACHQASFLDKYDMLELAAPGATFLLNSSVPADKIWDTLPREMQKDMVDKRLRFFVIDAYKVAEEAGLGRHISTVMQTCFFDLTRVLPREEAIARSKAAIEKTYGKRGREIVARNFAAIDGSLARLFEVKVPDAVTTARPRPPIVAPEAPDFVQRVTAVMLSGKGHLLPVSAFPIDGTWPSGTTKWEKRGIAQEIPIWDPAVCIQCNKCALVCPHAAIRAKVAEPSLLDGAPEKFLSTPFKAAEFAGQKYMIQVAPDDCTGCTLCVVVCPAKDKSNPRHKAIDMMPVRDHAERERDNFAFFDKLPEPDRKKVHLDVKGTQFLEPLFEFSGACAGCGETPYIKLLTQLFGDRALIANATGCSSIYGGNLPTTPYKTNADGRGPAWSNSLFEDNAEFGLGFRLAIDAQTQAAGELLQRLSGQLGDELVKALISAEQTDEATISAQRDRVRALRDKLKGIGGKEAQALDLIADYFVKKSVWIVGGDGWAYDIGYGGLDHVLASNHDVNLLVLDTEVYSNTGGQASKSTPIGAAAKFAAAGKEVAKKDLGMLAMAYGHVYVARVAFGAKDTQTIKAFQEAEAHPGPSLIIAYSHCIAHGYDLSHGLEQQKLAVESGVWPLYRFDPRRLGAGEAPLKLESGPIKAKVRDYMRNEGRFRMVELKDPARYAALLDRAEQSVKERRQIYEQLAGLHLEAPANAPAGAPAAEGTTKEKN
ncbi:MAG: pyruvate:ferredoxin (flavodoxin) oxidoreductase [Byssovorax sp.]